MAFLEGRDFNGPIGNVTAYRMVGVEKTVVRQKGGPSKRKIKKSPRFAILRLHQLEFGGRATMGKEVRQMLMPLKSVANYNISGPISTLLQTVQKQDKTNTLGQRAILLSQHPRLLEGFQLNKQHSFDSVVRQTISCSLVRETRSARIDIPALLRDINFFPNNNQPLFRITVSLGIVPDFKFNEGHERFEPPVWYDTQFRIPTQASTPWYSALEGSPDTTLEVALENIPADESYSLMLSIGVLFGTLYEGGEIRQVKYTGVAKILALRGGNIAETIKPNTPDDKSGNEVKSPLPQALKDNQGDDRNTTRIKTTDTVGQPQYVYTLQPKPDAVKPIPAQVYTYTYTFEQRQPEQEKLQEEKPEQKHAAERGVVAVAAPVLHRNSVPEKPYFSGEVLPSLKFFTPECILYSNAAPPGTAIAKTFYSVISGGMLMENVKLRGD